MTAGAPLRVWLVDDERLAIERLKRLLDRFEEVEVAGSATDPAQAIQGIRRDRPDALFLDIAMPGMNGFELLAQLPEQPCVIFTTAYDEYALKAFAVNSIDYLLKPVDREQLERALRKLERFRAPARLEWQSDPDLALLLKNLATTLRGSPAAYPQRIASRAGERVSFLDLNAVTHFAAEDKLTYAISKGRRHLVDATIADLERRLDPAKFVRIHRAILVNIDWIHEVNSWFAGKVILSLKDSPRTELTVARDRVRSLKAQLGI